MLHVETQGASQSPLVFIHGIGGTSRYWKSRVQPLASSHHLIFIDLLGYGLSPKPWTKYTVERHVEELHRALDNNGPLTLVGHSFGAIVALAFAAHYPQQVSRIILISLPYFSSKQGAMQYFHNSHSADRYVMTNIAFAAFACIMTRRVLRWLLPYVLRDLPKEVVEDLTQHTWRSYTSSVWDGMYRHDVFADCMRIHPDCRVLMLHGGLDKTAPLSGVKQLISNRTDWELRILPGGDHHPLLRNPHWCLQAIESILTEQ